MLSSEDLTYRASCRVYRAPEEQDGRIDFYPVLENECSHDGEIENSVRPIFGGAVITERCAHCGKELAQWAELDEEVLHSTERN